MISLIIDLQMLLSMALIFFFIEMYSAEQLRLFETFPIDLIDPEIAKLSIANPGKVAAGLLKEGLEQHPEKGNQYWANRTLAQLSVLYPWLRFLIIVGQIYKDGYGIRYANADGISFHYKDNRYKHVGIYYNVATDQPVDDKLDCYGNITHMFQSCAPDIESIAKHILANCAEPMGLYEVIRDDNRNIGIASNLPEHTLKMEEFQCQEGNAKKMWRVIYAQHQKMDNLVAIVDKMINKGSPSTENNNLS